MESLGGSHADPTDGGRGEGFRGQDRGNGGLRSPGQNFRRGPQRLLGPRRRATAKIGPRRSVVPRREYRDPIASIEPCTGDPNGDGMVSSTDLSLLRGAWGSNGSIVDGSDRNGDTIVNGMDLGVMLLSWGDCP